MRMKIDDDLQTASYVVNAKGNQELVSGSIWEPVHIANDIAWQEIERQIRASKSKIDSGRVSPLHYYMTANQMDVGLLAQYTGISRWMVHLHIIPFFFTRMRPVTVKKYADFFGVLPHELLRGQLKPPIYARQDNVT